MQIVLELDPREAYALRKFAVRVCSHEIKEILDGCAPGEAQLADAARYKLSTAIWAALGEPCAECGGPESNHEAN